MKSLVLKKIITAVVMLFVLSILICAMIHFLPGDPVTIMLGEFADSEQADALRAQLNLDKPFIFQYGLWIKGVLRGDWGNSILDKSPVKETVFERFPRTLMLCVVPIIIALLIAIVFGIISAARRNSFADLGISIVSLFLMSIPEFWTGIMLMLIFAVLIPVLPAGGYIKQGDTFQQFIRYMILPLSTIVISSTPGTLRMVRSSMLDVLDEDYIMLAKTKGNSNFRCNYVHGLRNAMIPIATSVSMQLTGMIGGAVVIEKVFQFPGLGLLLLNAINYRDYPVVQGSLLLFSICVVVINLITDLMYSLIDPRIRTK